MSRCSSPPLFVHLHHLNCLLLDPSSRCASPHSIDGVTCGSSTRSTSRISTVQVGQTVLDCYSTGISTRSYRTRISLKIVSYMGFSVRRKEKVNVAVWRVCMVDEVQSKRDTWGLFTPVFAANWGLRRFARRQWWGWTLQPRRKW